MRQLIHIARSHYFITCGGIFLAFSLAIIQIPLLNYLGYEFSTAIALVTPFALWLPARCEFSGRGPMGRGFPATTWLRCGALLAIPLGVATVNVAFVKNCAIKEGALYYMLLPVITSIWSVSLALMCCSVFRRPLRAYLLVLLIVLLYPVYLGYSSPQIFSYNFIYGYFPGISYDEVVRITPAFLLFRGVTLVAAAFFLCVVALAKQHEKKLRVFASLPGAGAVCLAFILVAAWFGRTNLKFESSEWSIQKSLSAHIETDHFVIHYAPGSFLPDELPWIAALHEFFYYQVASALQSGNTKVASYIYPDADSKLASIGTSTTNIAKPWLREIHLDKDSWQFSLKHEIVHVLAGEFGMPVIRAHYDIGLVEGLATAIDGEFGNRTLHQYAAAIRHFELVRDPQRLIGPLGFATHASSLSYVLMGSFCQYLIDRYGIIRFKDLYHGRSPDRLYGRSYDELVTEWQSFLARIPVPEGWRKHVEYYFRRPSIFAKECVRTIALLNDDGFHKILKNPEGAMADFSKALSISWNTESFSGLVRAASGTARYDTVVRLVDQALRDSLLRVESVSLLLLYGDALCLMGKFSSAEGSYRQALDLDLSDRLKEASAIRLAAMNDSALTRGFATYLSAKSDSEAAAILDNLSRFSKNPLVSLLKARIDFRYSRYQTVVDECESDKARFNLSVLNAMREQTLGRAFFYQKKFQTARVHFWKSLNDLTNDASVREVEEWIERCEWYERFSARIFKNF